MDERTVKMLTIRSWRRGMREMDLLLGPFAEAELPAMTDAEGEDFAALLEENDPDLYAWVVAASAGRTEAPPKFAALIARVAEAATVRLARSS